MIGWRMDNKYIKKHSKVYSNISKNVKRFGTEKGWIQQDLADKCEGVTRTKISKIENACEDYMLSTLIERCNVLGKSLEEITKEYENEDW